MPEALVPTPGQTVGPFFHQALPYPRDSELVPPAAPGALRLHGTVYDGAGEPVPDALVEIRQADADGNIPRVEGSSRRDGRSFTGWGRASTDPAGRYGFATVAPGGVNGGSPFFAVVVFARGMLNRLFTRAYLPGDALADDAFLTSVEEDRRETLVAARETNGDLRFDIHLQGDRETVFLAFPRHED
jgi:protocatechuate 3,4-dioxygenase, alpha subunit